MATPDRADAVWFADGLQFTCTRCGACCTGAEGYVWLNDDEIDRLALRVGESRREFLATRARRIGSRISLRERENGDCIFWSKNAGCTVYEDRPRQCRTWPFWNSNVESADAWEETRRHCPGSGQGRLYTVEEILQQSSVIDI